MDAETAARSCADTWSRAWPQRDVEAIDMLYADTAVYRSPAFRQPYLPPSVCNEGIMIRCCLRPTKMPTGTGLNLAVLLSLPALGD
jgi:hypothetical protein